MEFNLTMVRVHINTNVVKTCPVTPTSVPVGSSVQAKFWLKEDFLIIHILFEIPAARILIYVYLFLEQYEIDDYYLD